MKLRKSLFDYTTDAETKKDFCLSLTPKDRQIHIGPLASKDCILQEIKSALYFMRNAVEQHEQSLEIIICTDRHPMRLKYPFHGMNLLTRKPATRVAVLINILKTIVTKIEKQEKSTMRDVYYLNVELYQKQRIVGDWLAVLEVAFGCKKEIFNIFPSQKGLCYIPTDLRYDDLVLKGSTLVPYINERTHLDADWNKINRVIVLEKDAIFSKLVASKDVDKILVTGKGYPDFLTRLFLQRLMISAPAHVKFQVFTDSDPYGVDISLKYLENKQECYACPRLEYQGVYIHELMKKESSTGLQLLPLKQRDFFYAIKLLEQVTMGKNSLSTTNRRRFTRELQRQLFYWKKGEMNVVEGANFMEYFETKNTKKNK